MHKCQKFLALKILTHFMDGRKLQLSYFGKFVKNKGEDVM